MIGHRLLGFGEEKVVVLHGWSSDHTYYESLFPYLDTDHFTYAFIDLRGYGLSKEIPGKYTAEEVSEDVICLADHLGWDSFHLIGHSMSGMFVQRVAIDAKERVQSVIAITPTPACGSAMDEDALTQMTKTIEREETKRGLQEYLMGERAYSQWIEYNVKKWIACSDIQAVRGYLHAVVKTDFSDEAKGLEMPIIVLLGEKDANKFSEEMVKNTFEKYYPNLTVKTILEAGHYPMQEVPVQLASMINQILCEKQWKLSASV